MIHFPDEYIAEGLKLRDMFAEENGIGDDDYFDEKAFSVYEREHASESYKRLSEEYVRAIADAKHRELRL